MASSATERKSDQYKQFTEAIRLLHQGKYDKSRAMLIECKKKFSDQIEVQARVDVFLRVCEKRVKPEGDTPSGAEDLYVMGLLEHNEGRYKEAIPIFKSALKKTKSNGDYIHLALAASETRAGNTAEALKHLKQSVELDKANRLAALYDPDFEPLHKNEEFQKLVRPGSSRRK